MAISKPGRNELYPCVSGKNYKKCCLAKSDIGKSPLLSAEGVMPDLADTLWATLMAENFFVG